MLRFKSYRSKLQVSFLLLGLAAIVATGWESTVGATAALREATFDRLAAVRETRKRQVERYFADVGNHVLALATDESAINALEGFQAAWRDVAPVPESGSRPAELESYYEREILPRLRASGVDERAIRRWLPADPLARALHSFYLASNQHPTGSKSALLAAPGAGTYGDLHTRFHPTMLRYLSAFGFYDIFLIGPEGRVLYTVSKEIDLGAALKEPPYSGTPLGRAFIRAMSIQEPEEYIIEDYAPYPASYFAPAAFFATPVWRAGAKIGVLAIQVSIDEVNRVMTGDRRWRQEGLGETGHAYIVGPDDRLRSDVRFEIERPQEYLQQLAEAGIPPETIERVRRHRTAILNLALNPESTRHLRAGGPDTWIGRDARGIEVLCSHTPLNVQGLDWMLVAEIEAGEAFAPLRRMQARIIGLGLLVAAVFLVAARWLAASVTRPVLALAESARRMGERDFAARIPRTAEDEIGELASSFNRMAEKLERTTVSKSELEDLAGKLISAQEEERSRIARELHDDAAQKLAVIAMEIGKLERTTADEQAARSRLARVRQQIAELSDEIHRLSRSLHPSKLHDLGLVAAIESECRAFFELGGPPVEFSAEGEFEEVPQDIQLGLYRIVQESLRNIARHANASEATISLAQKTRAVELLISDDGGGFDRNGAGWRPGVGLASMEERSRLLGGRLTVASQPGEGTRIHAILPLGAPDEQAENPAR